MDTFGERLKKVRVDRNLLQKEVADTLKMSLSGYNGYENGYRMPGIKTLIKIAKYLNVSIDYLLGLENKTFIDKDNIIAQINDIEARLEKLKVAFEESK